MLDSAAPMNSHPNFRNPRHSILTAALALASLAGPAHAARPPAASGLPRNTVTLPRGSGPMADTVLAVVDHDRKITRSDFAHAWTQVRPPARPDSLTPQAASEFLDLLIGREALGAAALRQRFTLTREESLKYRGLRDRLTLQAALDSALHEVQNRMLAAGDTVTDAGALGIAARESLMARTRLEWNEPALVRMAAAFAALPKPPTDSGLMARIRAMGALPVVDSSERRVSLVSEDGQPFTVAEMIEAWSRLNPLERPRVDQADQVRDLAKNAVFERRLRREAARRKLVQRPDIAHALTREYEYYAVEHFVAREVYARMDTSTARLRRFHAEHEADFALPSRVVLTRLTLQDRRAADAMAVQLADAAGAESLVVKAARQGLRYRSEITEAVAGDLFRRAMRAGTGAVLGPDSSAGGWMVARVEAFRPGRPRPFDEARSLVAQRWYGEEGEHLMVALLERVRRATPVVINRRGLEFIKPK